MKKIIAFLLPFFWLTTLFSQNEQTKIFSFFIDDNISKPALRKTEKALKEAEEMSADILFLRLNTFGGELEAAEKIRTLLLEAPMPVYVFIDPNAASAGALISIACDSIYMSPGASIGAASVVNQEGTVMPDKYQSYMRSLMRSTAEENGRNPLIAESMVDPDTYVEGVSEKGKVLTLTTNEAMKHGYCEGEANSIKEVIQHAGVTDYEIVEQELSWIDKIISFLINPAISGLLIMLIVGGIYFELQSPGIGFPLAAAIVGALLYFMPHYLEGLAAHWEILLFLLGLGLLIVEVFVTPGFGVAGVLGIILIVAALVLAMVFNVGFDFNFAPSRSISFHILLVLTSAILGFFLALWLGKKVLTVQTRYGSLSLNTELNTEQGYIAQDMSMATLIGKEGVALSFMRPVGKVEIENDIYDATAAEGLIEKDELISVIKFENAQLIVAKKK